LATFFGAGLSESLESSEEEAAFLATFLALLELALLAAETPEAALDLLTGLASDESESESEEDSTFFLDFLTSLTGAATFFSTFFSALESLFLSTLTFLAGASDDELSESEELLDSTFFVCF